MESISGVKGDNSVKIFGPDLEELQRLAKLAAERLQSIDGIRDVGILEVMGQSTFRWMSSTTRLPPSISQTSVRREQPVQQ
jgi:cobalt-zinc-cadmium resistance protein CzcA